PGCRTWPPARRPAGRSRGRAWRSRASRGAAAWSSAPKGGRSLLGPQCWDLVSPVAGKHPPREAHADEGGGRPAIGTRVADRDGDRGARRARRDPAPARPLRAVLDRRGDLGRCRRAPAERDPRRAAPGRLAAPLLPAAARVDGALRLVAE